MVAIAVAVDGHRQVLAVERANQESMSNWRDFLLVVKPRGLHGVEFVISDDYARLKQAIREVLPEAAWQRCYVYFLRRALDYASADADPYLFAGVLGRPEAVAPSRAGLVVPV